MTTKLFFLFVFFSTFVLALNGQNNDKKAYYWVALKDKLDSPFSVEKPEEFLSQKAIDRRQKFNIPIQEEDLPVNPNYLDSLKANGAKIHHTSRWLNAATVLMNKEKVAQLATLAFIDTVFYVGRSYKEKAKVKKNIFKDTLPSNLTVELYHGYATPQIQMINGDSLHQMGYTGKGLTVAVLDGGFRNVDVMPHFDSLRSKPFFSYAHDFVDGDQYVFESSTHGTKVLSAMAANIPGLLVGTGPDADYVCLKTEDVRGEYRIEECNWVAALEYADSLGADIINSSLGYSTFSDESMNYRYEDLNGYTSIASQAADIAFSKGMIVVTSAGNEGNDPWKYIGIPSDAKFILAIGSTNLDGTKAAFSSFGPTADGRVKPDVSCLGSFVIVASHISYRPTTASGTSISSPIIAGMIASLWQAFPDKSNLEIIDAVRKSGHQAGKPDNELGYGIPDFMKAYYILKNNPSP